MASDDLIHCSSSGKQETQGSKKCIFFEMFIWKEKKKLRGKYHLALEQFFGSETAVQKMETKPGAGLVIEIVSRRFLKPTRSVFCTDFLWAHV
ncbi:hypothetical protein COP1_042045 [Malus domestica]